MSELSTAIRKLIDKLRPIDYYASYQCKVVSQNLDGTLELDPFDNRLKPGPTHVVIDAPAGYKKISVKQGALCMLSFRNGKPNAPYVDCFRLGDAFSEVAITADTITLNDGTRPVARQGDQIGTLTATTPPTGGTVTFVYTSPDGTVLTSPTIVLKIGQGNSSIKA